jgi:hypothetical protein
LATKLLVCPECSSAVAPGRFACTSCGALLASVASAPRSLGWVEDMTPPVVTPPPPVAESNDSEATDAEMTEMTEAAGRTTIGPAWAHGLLERAPGETDLEIDEDAPLAAAAGPVDALRPVYPEVPASGAEPVAEAEAVVEAEPVAEAAPYEVVEPAVEAEPFAEAKPFAEAEPVLQSDGGAPAGQVGDAEPLVASAAIPSALFSPAVEAQAPKPSEPSWPEKPSWPPPGAERLAPLSEPAPRPRAGAYLPPSAVLTTIDEAPEAMTAGTPGRPMTAASSAASTGVTVASAAEKKPARVLPALDPTVPPKVVVLGAGIAGLGFLLPWAAVVVGSGRIGGYLDQWGLAGPGHPLVLLVLVALGAWASQIERLPAWVRPGLPAAVVAGLLVGLVWPYVFGSLQSTVGVYLTLVGAIVLASGGLLDLWAERHAGEPRAV